MKSIIIITEQLSDRSLNAALPAVGIASAVISHDRAHQSVGSAMENYRALRNPQRFRPNYRIELVVDEAAVDAVFDSVAIAYGAGVFSDAEMWVETGAVATAA